MELGQTRPIRPPVRVERFTRSKLQIMNGTFEELQGKYDKFVNHIQSYGGRIHGSKFAMGVLPTLAIFYEVPISVTDELIKEGLEGQ